MTLWESLATIAGLTLITIVTRAFFLLPEREVPMPGWLREGLRYAPLAALVAVVAPEVLLTDGRLVDTWRDPKVFAAAAGAAWFFWRRGILGTIVVGTAVMVGLRVGLGW
jgi:branched-subunit amino acid transport protein